MQEVTALTNTSNPQATRKTLADIARKRPEVSTLHYLLLVSVTCPTSPSIPTFAVPPSASNSAVY